jgi:predicted small secreted protein
MNWKKFIAGMAVGFVAAYVVEAKRKQRMISSEKALSLAKAAFLQQAPISGSWIQTNPETYKKTISSTRCTKAASAAIMNNTNLSSTPIREPSSKQNRFKAVRAPPHPFQHGSKSRTVSINMGDDVSVLVPL